MKEFVKMTLATMAGLFIFGIVAFFFMFAMLGAVAAMGEKQPVMPREAVLKIDMSTFTLSEQSAEANPMDMLLAGGEAVQPLGIYSAINAINAAASDPAVKFIYMKPDGVSGGTAQIEEFRKALKNFRNSGKAIVSYIESPGNGSYYLASVSDKIFMTPHDGAMNMFTGLSSQMIFLKDLLDKVGVNVQLIRHGKYPIHEAGCSLHFALKEESCSVVIMCYTSTITIRNNSSCLHISIAMIRRCLPLWLG